VDDSLSRADASGGIEAGSERPPALSVPVAEPGEEGLCEIVLHGRHFPHLDDPLRFIHVMIDFVETSPPARVDAGRWGELLRSGSP
jgi:hypothetical protein